MEKPKSVAQLLKEMEQRDPEAHKRALARGYGIDGIDDPETYRVPGLAEALREAGIDRTSPGG